MDVRRRIAIGMSAALVSGSALMGVGSAEAASYNMVVPKFNGTAYSGAQTKVVEDLAGDLHSSTVGGSYVVDAGMSGGRQTLGIQWQRDVSDNQNRKLPNIWASGATVHLAVSNDFNTPVDVQVTGTWEKR